MPIFRAFFRASIALALMWAVIYVAIVAIARIASNPVLVMNFGTVFGVYDIARDTALITPPVLPTSFLQAAWSPDGRYIADGGNGPAVIFDTHEHRLTTTGERTMRCLSWSQSNQLGCKDFGDTAYAVDAHTASITQIFPTYPIGNFAWGPDGNQIAFSSQNSTYTYTDIYVANSLDDTPRLLTSYEGWMLVDSWSPDSRYLLTYATSHEIWTVYLISLDGGHIFCVNTDLEIPFPDLRAMTWSPDGSHLAFRSITRTSLWTYVGPLYVLELETMSVRQIAEEGDGVRWSPDGRRILYMHIDFNGGSPIHSMITVNRDGSDPADIARNIAAFWSPDSEHVFLSGHGALYLTTADGKQEPRLIFALEERFSAHATYAFWQ